MKDELNRSYNGGGVVYLLQGELSRSYVQYYHPFTNKELRQQIVIYIFNGISPSPILEYNFKIQNIHIVHVNDFIYGAFGLNVERRRKHLKCFFEFQNLAIEIPSRARYPNWKVRTTVIWMNEI